MNKWEENRIGRFWNQVEVTETCWNWTGRVSWDGYGQFRWREGPRWLARATHRWAYLELVGPYEGVLDHLCRNTLCVNPNHLEPVTQTENQRRGLWGVLRTHCNHGHPWIPENLYRVHKGRGKIANACRLCQRQRSARLRASLRGSSLLTI